MLIETCLALESVHTLGIMHRDLKPKNIFLTRDYEIRIGDFGVFCLSNLQISAVSNPTTFYKFAGTPMYSAPEIWEGHNTLTNTIDMWSLGCVIYELGSGGLKSFDVSNMEILH
jgi:serine/threonine protein kinase